MRYWLVMPAAGTGRRFGERIPKQYATSARPHRHRVGAGAVPRRCALCRRGGGHLAPEDKWWPQVAERIPPVIVAPGRRASAASPCAAGLQALSRKAKRRDWVLVHDAARPCLTDAELDRLLDASWRPCGRRPAGAARLGHAQARRRADARRRDGRPRRTCGARHAADVSLRPAVRGAGQGARRQALPH